MPPLCSGALWRWTQNLKPASTQFQKQILHAICTRLRMRLMSLGIRMCAHVVHAMWAPDPKCVHAVMEQRVSSSQEETDLTRCACATPSITTPATARPGNKQKTLVNMTGQFVCQRCVCTTLDSEEALYRNFISACSDWGSTILKAVHAWAYLL